MRWMTWRAMGLANVAGHVIGCRSTQVMMVQHAWNDVASNISQTIPVAAAVADAAAAIAGVA